MRVREPSGKSKAARLFGRRAWTLSGPPVEAAGDHEVQDKPEIVVDADGDAFADAANSADGLSFGGGDGRTARAQQKGAVDADVLEALAEDARLERGDVGGDVGQFRHGYQIAWLWRGNLQASVSVEKPGKGLQW